MTSNHDKQLRSPVGFSRRTLIQTGYSSLAGIGLTSMLAGRSKAAETESPAVGSSRAKQIVIVFLTGAASHHDTFDMKPDAPAEIRGEFNPVSTSVSRIQICEHLPHLAQRADRYAVVRTLSHKDNNHLMSTHHVLTGHFQPGAFFDKVASRDDWPCYSSGLGFLRPRHDGIPSGVNLPTFLLQGPLTWPGQHAGFLGPKFDPWQIKGDPQKPDFKVDSLTLSPGIDVSRLDRRQALLDEVNTQQRQLGQAAEATRLTDDQQLAFSILTSSRLAQAFELNRETDSVRDRYGRHTTGQSLLVARRLIEVGVPVVQVNIGAAQTWDNHGNIFPTLKDRLLPPLDQGVAGLLDDLCDTGRLDETLVLMLGEFGRTPKINAGKGRDHWGPCFFGFFAGGGVQGGQVIGRSDDIGAYPVTSAYSPDDVGATVYKLLGIPPEAEVHDRLGRPSRLNSGNVIEPLFG
ncbi:MAG: DUF1501 domain-containing protein [Planctomycetota bacterium]|nr:DUF1501 domain-containing protein [Planctomycetota bacterium]